MDPERLQGMDARTLMREIRARHPPFFAAVAADARVTAAHRGERHRFRSRADTLFAALRLAWVSDAYLAQLMYRAKARMQALHVPVLPRVAHRLAMLTAQISIGDPVVVEPGVYILHGQVVIDGIVEVRSGTVIAPWVTIGLRAPELVGPTIGPNADIGTGAKVLGPVRVGSDAKVGANAVVLSDVPDGATAVGIPARAIDAEAHPESAVGGTG